MSWRDRARFDPVGNANTDNANRLTEKAIGTVGTIGNEVLSAKRVSANLIPRRTEGADRGLTFAAGEGKGDPPPEGVSAPESFAAFHSSANSAESANSHGPLPEGSAWTNKHDERAAIVEHDGKSPRALAEGIARLDPDHPPGDVPLKRWQRFVDDVGRFLDSPLCAEAAALGWGPLDLFGCDRERPFARIDHSGLLWLLDGNTLVDLDRHRAVIELPTGVRQTHRRKPLVVGEVTLAWEASR